MTTTDNVQPRASFKGFSAELLVASMFASEGALVSFPIVPSRYDLIVDQGGKLYRIQIKLAWRQAQRKRAKGYSDAPGFFADFKANRKRRYVVSDFDYVGVVCSPERIYVIPTSRLASPLANGNLVGLICFKDRLESGRKDNIAAATKWDSFLNNFRLG